MRIDTECTRLNLPLLMGKHRLELERLQVACDQGREKLKKLISDREAMIVKAPIDGIVYYGRAVGESGRPRAWKRSAAGRRSCPTKSS